MVKHVLGFGLGLGVIALALSGCATTFTGDAHVGGPDACRARCDGWGLDFAGMVAMGEYSDACVCHVRGAPTAAPVAAPAARSADLDDAAAIAGGASGVIMQMRRQQAQAGGSYR